MFVSRTLPRQRAYRADPGADPHPEDEEALLSYRFYLRAVDKMQKDGIIYIIAKVEKRK